MIRRYLHGRRLRVIQKHMPRLPDLDIGAGREHKGEITMDILPRLETDIVGDLLHLPLKSGAVRSLVCSHVIEHVADSDQALREITRVLTDDGLAFFFLPDDKSFLWRLLEPLWTAYYSRFVMKEASPHTHMASFTYDSFLELAGRYFSRVVKSGKINAGAEIYAVCRK